MINKKELFQKINEFLVLNGAVALSDELKEWYNNQLPDLVEMEEERLKWSLETFPEATPISSLRKAEEEMKEVEVNIESGIKDEEEYADWLMCLLDSAGRDGIWVGDILIAFARKKEKNKLRKWKKNPDNSYSHIKQQYNGTR